MVQQEHLRRPGADAADVVELGLRAGVVARGEPLERQAPVGYAFGQIAQGARLRARQARGAQIVERGAQDRCRVDGSAEQVAQAPEDGQRGGRADLLADDVQRQLGERVPARDLLEHAPGERIGRPDRGDERRQRRVALSEGVVGAPSRGGAAVMGR